jgi:hypothetical protein
MDLRRVTISKHRKEAPDDFAHSGCEAARHRRSISPKFRIM